MDKVEKTSSIITATKFEGQINVEMIDNAEKVILKLLQIRAFNNEICDLMRNNVVKKTSNIAKLSTFIDSEGLLRVGGRNKRYNLELQITHPILLPKKENITELIITWCHKNVAHGGRGFALNELRSNGFWVIGANSVARSMIYKCVICRVLRGKKSQQLMANLPKEGLVCEPPFTHYGVDMFGPFVIKERRKELKRYCAMYTCFSCRAIHI